MLFDNHISLELAERIEDPQMPGDEPIIFDDLRLANRRVVDVIKSLVPAEDFQHLCLKL